LCYSSNTLSSAAQGEFDQLISGKGIVLNIDTWTTLQQTCLSQQPRVQFFRSLANLKDVFVTCSRAYVNAEDGAVAAGAGINGAKTAYFGAELKEVNYLPDMMGQIQSDIAPARRVGAVANNDLPETTFQFSIGSKLIPTLPVKGRQQTPFLAMALGLESKREGFLNHLSWKHNKNVWGLNLEVYTGTDLDNSGLSTRAGESLQCHFEHLGLSGYFPDKIWLHIRSTAKLELRTGSSRLLD
jgi:hypothetical protein